jgi:hypothetical protein
MEDGEKGVGQELNRVTSHASVTAYGWKTEHVTAPRWQLTSSNDEPAPHFTWLTSAFIGLVFAAPPLASAHRVPSNLLSSADEYSIHVRMSKLILSRYALLVMTPTGPASPST